MIVTPEYVKGKKAVLRDAEGNKVPYAISYNTETQTAELAVFNKDTGRFEVRDGALVIKSVHLPGSSLEIDGVKVN